MTTKSIRLLRLEKGLTQEGLAELASVAQSTLSQYESGAVSPSLRAAQRIALALGVSLESIIDPEGEPVGEST